MYVPVAIINYPLAYVVIVELKGGKMSSHDAVIFRLLKEYPFTEESMLSMKSESDGRFARVIYSHQNV